MPEERPREPETVEGEIPGATVSSPPFRPLEEEETRSATPAGGPVVLAVGERLDDFEILRPLGHGSFATVYLARQLSLDRHVALKVSADRGHEARTLAGLEHDHIVNVFAESTDRARGLRLLCMQLVPGTTLEQVIRVLASLPRGDWSGRAILNAIDSLSTLPAPFESASLRDRDLLARSDFVEAVCWLGARLAEALSHAHARGVLHRDIKPANILLSRYGRPLLADFNVAFDVHRARASELFGGTLGYMAPEHLDAFNPDANTPPDAVDERSDVYSLGVVLFELLSGRLPFPREPRRGHVGDVLRELAEERRAQAPDLPTEANVPDVLRRVVRRCLAPAPADRYQSAGELSAALDGCRHLHRMRDEMPAGGWLTRAALRRPFATLAVLALLPHLLGSAVNISYNAVRIVNDLTPEQRTLFARLILVYNAIAYPFCLLLLGRIVLPVLRVWRRLRRDGPVEDLAG
ncbi:MAG TPA: serine/threonine-protein kinase, partial [Gemmataceae bacterium]|nr:serine/threonine-protein kinase [Gemmataceae bacterium]